MSKIKYYFRLLLPPLGLLFIFISIQVVWRVFDVPEPEVFFESLRSWFDLYGLPVLFLSALVESLLLVGAYFPGSFVIIASVLLTDSVGEAVLVVSLVTIAFMISHTTNYVLGRYGWHKALSKFGAQNSLDKYEERLSNRGLLAFLGSYWLPSMAALLDTAAGIMGIPFKKFLFYSITASILWNSFMGITTHTLGDRALVLFGSNGLNGVLIQALIVVTWSLILIYLDRKERLKKL